MQRDWDRAVTCIKCHTAREVLSASHPASIVHASHVAETRGACHEGAPRRIDSGTEFAQSCCRELVAQGLVARFVDSSARLETEARRAEALPGGSSERSNAIARLVRRFVGFATAEERLLFRPIERAGRRPPEPVPALVRDQRRLVRRALDVCRMDCASDVGAGFMEELEAHLDDETRRLLPEIEVWMEREHLAPAPAWYADELLARHGEGADRCPEHWLG